MSDGPPAPSRAGHLALAGAGGGRVAGRRGPGFSTTRRLRKFLQGVGAGQGGAGDGEGAGRARVGRSGDKGAWWGGDPATRVSGVLAGGLSPQQGSRGLGRVGLPAWPGALGPCPPGPRVPSLSTGRLAPAWMARSWHSLPVAPHPSDRAAGAAPDSPGSPWCACSPRRWCRGNPQAVCAPPCGLPGLPPLLRSPLLTCAVFCPLVVRARLPPSKRGGWVSTSRSPHPR